jgi:hypothetical protein
MGDVSSGAEVWLRCSQVLPGLTKYAFRLLFSIALAATVFLAATIMPAPGSDNLGETTVEHTSYDLHDKGPCDEGFVCSAYIFLQSLGDGLSETEYRILLSSLEMPLRNLSTPLVNLPPPRVAS